MSEPEYTLIYHAGLPGRGEFIRLYFEAVGVEYKDTAREIGQDAIAPFLSGDFAGAESNPTPFAPPVLKHNNVVLTQTSNIVLYLSSQLPPIEFGATEAGEPSSKRARKDGSAFGDTAMFHANELFLTIMDLTNEAHDVHHPISTALYYEDQKEAAMLSAGSFRDTRVPKYLAFFEANIEKAGTSYLLKSGPSFADLGLFQALDGLYYAFPKLMAKLEPSYPLTFTLYNKVKSSPRIKAYLGSIRRTLYSKNGVFRSYPELDLPDKVDATA